MFTVFTATYNRAHVLHRVYHSPRAQTFRDFEWLVVDDAPPTGPAPWPPAGAPRPAAYCRQLDRVDAGSYVDDERHAGGAGQDAAGRRVERSGCLALVLLAIGPAVQ